MFRILPYIALFLTAILSQVLFFDNLTVGVLFAPLVYTLFLILMPLETPPYLMLGLGIATGMVVDAMTGSNGENSIATIFIAFFRAPILTMLFGKERVTQRGVPSELMLGYSDFFRYIALMVALHHLIFFAFDTLTFDHFEYTALRYLLSTGTSILYVWLLARLFTINNLLK